MRLCAGHNTRGKAKATGCPLINAEASPGVPSYLTHPRPPPPPHSLTLARAAAQPLAALGLLLWPMSFCCPLLTPFLWMLRAPFRFGRIALKYVPC